MRREEVLSTFLTQINRCFAQWVFTKVLKKLSCQLIVRENQMLTIMH